MQRKNKLPLGDILYEGTGYKLRPLVYQEQNVVAFVIKGYSPYMFEKINACKEKLSTSNHTSVLKIFDVVSNRGDTIVIMENFSNVSYEYLAKNVKFSQHDLLNHAITLSASCISLVAEGYIPEINFETICFDNKGALKIIHPHLIDTLYKMDLETARSHLSNAVNNIKLLFRAPQSFGREFQKNEASLVYQFGLFLLYSTLGNLDFMNTTSDKIKEIVLSRFPPAIPAHCPVDIAAIINKCISRVIRERPSFAEIRDELLSLEIKQMQQTVGKIQQEKDSLLSRISKEVIETDVMKAIQVYGVFNISDKSQPKACDYSNKAAATLK